MNVTRYLKDVAHRRVKPARSAPRHIPDQYDYIQQALTGDDPAWVLLLDAGRYDIFDQLVWDYFDGNLTRVYNGGVGYTGDWFERNARRQYPHAGLFSYLPLRFQRGDYDGSEHFATAPDIGSTAEVKDRLANLGYMEKGSDTHPKITSPSDVNRAALESGVSGGIVRYLKPHPPFVGMENLTSGSGKMRHTKTALANGEISHGELTGAYIETYKLGLEAAQDFTNQVSGPVYLTADHGECLTCGQLFHGRKHEQHDHLTIVPWFEVDQVL